MLGSGNEGAGKALQRKKRKNQQIEAHRRLGGRYVPAEKYKRGGKSDLGVCSCLMRDKRRF